MALFNKIPVTQRDGMIPIHLAHLFGRDARPATPRRQVVAKPVGVPSFAHLAPGYDPGPLAAAPYAHLASVVSTAPYVPPPLPAPVPTPPSPQAAAPNAALERERLTWPKPPPRGSAAEAILMAGAKSRTPTSAAPMPSDPAARAIINAGRRSRGEEAL
jgi:hypothetical protein